jgi:hypothetical protein
MWLVSWFRTVALNLLFIAGVMMVIAFAVGLAGFYLVPPGAALAVFGARGIRRMALAD